MLCLDSCYLSILLRAWLICVIRSMHLIWLKTFLLGLDVGPIGRVYGTGCHAVQCLCQEWLQLLIEALYEISSAETNDGEK